MNAPTDVAGVDDVLDTGQVLFRFRPQQSVGVGDDADDHGRSALNTSSGCQEKSSW